VAIDGSYEEGMVSINSKNNNNTLESLRLAGAYIAFYSGSGTAGSEKMRINSSGDVGIGTTAMNTTLNLYSSSNTQIGFQDASTGTGNADGFRVGYNGTYGQMWLFENAAMRFATNNTERMRIDSYLKMQLCVSLLTTQKECV